MRGADVLIQTLQVYDVQTIFALSGNQIMPVFDALFGSEIRLIHTRHEAAAVYMAEAHAQISGRVGVALVTAGGGLSNAVGALAAARASDTPILLLSGDSPVVKDGKGAFQEMDQIGLSHGLTKGSRRVMHADEMAEATAWAIDLAMRGRRGPVHLSLPADVITGLTDIHSLPSTAQTFGEPLMPDLTAFQLAKRPLVLLGPSLNDTRATGLTSAIQQSLKAPVLVMESPRGLNDPALGRLKDVAAEADHVLCLGKAVDFTVVFGATDTWPNVKNWDVFLGDENQLSIAKDNLGALLNTAILCEVEKMALLMAATATAGPDRNDWICRAASLCDTRVQAPATEGLSPHEICQVVQKYIDAAPDATLVCDGGEFGQWAQAALHAPKRIINGTSGTIGGGVGYAIGVKAANANASVFALMGDGTVGFHLSEFETAVRAELPFIAIVGNDNRWNAEHLIQSRSYGADRRIGCDLSAARYDLAVTGLGGTGAFVRTRDELDVALSQAVKSNLPSCINVKMVGLAAPTF